MINEVSSTFDDDVSVSQAIVDAVCELHETEPEQLEFVLYDWVSPDALAELITWSSSQAYAATVEFRLADYLVTVRSDRSLTVQRTSATATAAGSEPELAPEM